MDHDMNAPIRTAADVVALWPDYETMARELGPDVKDHQPRDWARRGSIPAQYYKPIIEAARARGWLHVTADLLTDIAARRRDVPDVELAAAAKVLTEKGAA